MSNKFPSDDADDFDQLRRGLADVQALLDARPPLTEASKGWILTDMPSPPTPEAGKTHIYSQGGRMRARSLAGDVPLVPPEPFPIAAWQADPASPTSSTIGTTPTAAQYNQLRADYIDLRDTFIALLDKLIDADLMLPG